MHDSKMGQHGIISKNCCYDSFVHFGVSLLDAQPPQSLYRIYSPPFTQSLQQYARQRDLRGLRLDLVSGKKNANGLETSLTAMRRTYGVGN